MRPIFNETKTSVQTDASCIPWDISINAPTGGWDFQAGRTCRAALDAAGMKAPDPYVAPPKPAVEIRSQDMFAQFTPADGAKIQTAISANISFWLLWSALQAQTEPMVATSTRFQQGWSALTSVLGKPRMNEIATALGATVLVA